MTDTELCKIMSTKPPIYERSLISIPLEDISIQHSSLTDYIDAKLGYTRSGMSLVDDVIMRLHIGAVYTIEQGHYGTILPIIDDRGHCVGGSVQFVNVDTGHVIRQETLVENLYNWYAFDYYVSPHVFFGEHLLSGRPIGIVQEEKTAILGMMAENSVDWLAVGRERIITDVMVDKLRGKRVVMFADDLNVDYWKERYGSLFMVNESFVERDIDSYLMDRTRNNLNNNPSIIVKPNPKPSQVLPTSPKIENTSERIKKEQEQRWHGRNPECHLCEHSHEAINGTYCEKLKRYVEYGKGDCE